ncbi:MAG: alpha-1,2-fucosyltransferase, partial [Spirochaetes bacterium]|nr:alpha-1,2-fucosyltransferase [Spirochaetota bacterium]
FKINDFDYDQQLLKQIKNTNAIALHIRRGDYKNLELRSIYSQVDLTYYQEAIKWLSNKVKNPFIYIFTNDPQWVKQEFSISLPCIIVNHTGDESDIADLYLMSQCKHFIIANSTFSWWGAWLGNNSKKLIIAPKKWYKNPELEQDLIPDEWVRI